MFKRTLSDKLCGAVKSFYAVSLIGPRQSGKTTLLKQLFPDYQYINLEDPDTLAKIQLDPRGFFADTQKKWIIDEAQEYPDLFSYLLGFIDSNKVMGQFIFSGSKNFLLMEKISQSLAGRVAIFEVLPLTYQELLTDYPVQESNIWDLIYKGFYPGVYAHQTPVDLWYKSYVTTYIQRDVRQLIQIKDLSKFYLFLRLCAARNGQLINYSEIGTACGVSHTTIAEWINLLEISYITFRLQPFYKNFNKRLVKTPKLYFYDSGLVCHLLGIEGAEHAQIHASRGALFEGYVISEILKHYMAKAQTPHLYFWNNNKGFEVDLLVERKGVLNAVKIKASSTFSKSFLKQLTQWKDLGEEAKTSDTTLIYTGDESFTLSGNEVISYKEIDHNFP